MRKAKSYSIIDHQIIHGGYLYRLSHEAMILYLFLVVVGNREGRSFWSDISIAKILRISLDLLTTARQQLIKENLISYRKPYWWVKNIYGGREDGRNKREDIVLEKCNEIQFSSDRRSNWCFQKKSI